MTVNGGTGPYSYLWTPGGFNTAAVSGLPAGQYTVFVTDANGCQQTATTTVSNPSTPSVAIASQTNVSCNGANDGAASVSVSGGCGPYTYNWQPYGGTANSASSLGAGNFTVTVTDSNNCSQTQAVTITQPAPLNANISYSDATCGNNNGVATANVTGGSAGYTFIWHPTGGNGQTASALSPGNYNVQITDASGCTVTTQVTIGNVPGPVLTVASVNNVSCSGLNDGSATVSATGGTGTISYTWQPAVSTSTTASNLPAGNYLVTATDSNGCSQTQNIIITQPQPLTAATSANPATCNQNNGSAYVTVSGGSGVYSYVWNPQGGTGSTATALPAGQYTVTSTDGNGCSITSAVNVVNTGSPIITLSSQSNVSCSGGNNGTATVTVSSGTQPYTYSWSASGASGPTATNLAAGQHTVSVTDSNGCTQTLNITITQPAVLSSTATSTPASCNQNNGSATVNVSGGTGGYTYSWNPSGSTTQTITGLAPWNYTVVITDANGCTDQNTVVVGNAGSPSIAVVSQSNVSCTIGSDGSAAVSVTGGAGPYTYSWAPSGGTGNSAT